VEHGTEVRVPSILLVWLKATADGNRFVAFMQRWQAGGDDPLLAFDIEVLLHLVCIPCWFDVLVVLVVVVFVSLVVPCSIVPVLIVSCVCCA